MWYVFENRLKYDFYMVCVLQVHYIYRALYNNKILTYK